MSARSISVRFKVRVPPTDPAGAARRRVRPPLSAAPPPCGGWRWRCGTTASPRPTRSLSGRWARPPPSATSASTWAAPPLVISPPSRNGWGGGRSLVWPKGQLWVEPSGPYGGGRGAGRGRQRRCAGGRNRLGPEDAVPLGRLGRAAQLQYLSLNLEVCHTRHGTSASCLFSSVRIG